MAAGARLPQGIALALALALVLAPPVAGAEAVDLELVLAADGSGSIDDDELRLQRAGYAEAIASPEVLRAIRGGYRQAIAVAYVEWGAPESQHVIADWAVVRDEASARAFGERLMAAPRAAWGYNSISNAIHFAAGMIHGNALDGRRKVIDVSGDGPQIGGRPLEVVRRETVASGITINALVVDRPGGHVRMGGIPLSEHYERDVIGGHGAFVIVARDRRHFADAVRKKMVQEIAVHGNGDETASAVPKKNGAGGSAPRMMAGKEETHEEEEFR